MFDIVRYMMASDKKKMKQGRGKESMSVGKVATK